ncbi:histone-lysine N-methyltransferase ASHH2-like isoform X2 [Olea europaea subsp. europaea]|uniref:Histone-lysine N-methyltransferase ASHH2-like isoform X2 n=1 Tax=Olea europaea subsp. europaea TaxID=158383 RepID=A0A8S0UDA6_OLEEU|nr:histone-lysine N-methyltransferase ASHH2-like isoform X2 [Olea europaea subsp. europaea]
MEYESMKVDHWFEVTDVVEFNLKIMVCHCKPPLEGRMGCGAKCLNRMLNIECVQGTCPCGELCSNQQFQKRRYAKLKWFWCGKKGYGLQAHEYITEGQFLIEYVGENIDACVKGNLGRFINHSCNPNCPTEKWMVNGEVCVGLFALRDIKKGEEVTFDYNYVRVFGAA